jgi:hypothetical protein
MSSRSTETVLLDANLLVLFVVGSVSRDLVSHHRRTRAFTPREFDLLAATLSNAAGVVCCPNVVTEASNLLRQSDRQDERLATALANFVKFASETYLESVQAIERDEYRRLGVTDAALLSLTAHGPTLYTVDLDLYVAAVRRGYHAVNFNYLIDQS